MSTTQKRFGNKLPAWLSLSSGIILLIFGMITFFFETIILSDIIWIDVIPFSEDVSLAIMLSLMSGIIIVLVSLFMLIKPSKTRILGVVVLFFSIIACFGMGIFTIGGIIGITGGFFAMIDGRKQ